MPCMYVCVYTLYTHTYIHGIISYIIYIYIYIYNKFIYEKESILSYFSIYDRKYLVKYLLSIFTYLNWKNINKWIKKVYAKIYMLLYSHLNSKK